ncbi:MULTISPECIES: ABC transporter ATP-binding protein [unclassified Streptomyces]|uniref:ABC transporter ATP-binding protein n=1 Tax=unclassified Streptomyces TaxID=2593676 RepID=UPI000371D1F8|nr:MULTISPECIES: ABC transporter ATP-binding protein [unclassified Streptomyces]EYT81212.1 ABC transporter [Streptomyces sp. Tu 6176]
MSADTTSPAAGPVAERPAGPAGPPPERREARRVRRASRQLLYALLRPHRWPSGAALAALVLENAFQLAGPLLVARAIDLGIPRASAGDWNPLIRCVAGFTACGLLAAGTRYAFFRISGSVGQAVLLELRTRIFDRARHLPVAFHESYTSGAVISRLTADVDAVRDLIEASLDGLLTSVLTVTGISVLLLWLDAPLALVVLASIVPLVAMTRWFRRRSRIAYRRARDTVAEIIVRFGESMNAVRAVQAFRAERRKHAAMNRLNDTFRDAHTDALEVVARYTAGVRLTGNIALAVVLALGAWRVSSGALPLGVLAAFLLYLRRFYDPLDELATFNNLYASAAAALEKIADFLATPSSVPEPAAPVPLPRDRPVRGALAFRGVGFRYRPDTPPVLRGLDLDVPAGQTLAVVGATGAGKSTVAKLAARFYDPTSGAVLLDGVDLRRLPDRALRREITLVTQENFLFDGSVMENIALARPDAGPQEVRAAARAVGADAFISALPEGYDTEVRKRGSRLSAGQRQLVALARAFLADPAVLLLDEATSSLDIPTELAVRRAMDALLAGRTSVIIAHRLSTVLAADRVLVLADGAVVEDGPPARLASGDGPFAALHARWIHATG